MKKGLGLYVIQGLKTGEPEKTDSNGKTYDGAKTFKFK
jgi:hypothetical protein